MTKLLCIFGTRPEAIKMAPVIRALQATYGQNAQICITGQHREMLDPVLKLFQIKPDYDLNIMQPAQTLAELSSRLLIKLHEILAVAKPERIIVHGDTTTTFIATLSAFYHQISVAHVEAGLRSHQLFSPWPEEANRRLTGVIADCHFAPTPAAAENLKQEGIPTAQIHITGNTVIDALLLTQQMIASQPPLQVQLAQQFNFLDSKKRLLLITGHRRESFGQGFHNICQALAKLAQREDVQIVYPVHLNPQVREPVTSLLGDLPNIYLLSPLEYLPFVYLMTQADLILTDSGGIQEEAPALGVPVLVLRDITERPEAITAGTARLVGTQSEQIVAHANELLDNTNVYERMAQAHNPYGDGTASQKIVTILQQYHSPPLTAS